MLHRQKGKEMEMEREEARGVCVTARVHCLSPQSPTLPSTYRSRTRMYQPFPLRFRPSRGTIRYLTSRGSLFMREILKINMKRRDGSVVLLLTSHARTPLAALAAAVELYTVTSFTDLTLHAPERGTLWTTVSYRCLLLLLFVCFLWRNQIREPQGLVL